tara:strand:- start:393 stop:1004 length:612 start_codon:yes stop_codon:yes gene_type:complete
MNKKIKVCGNTSIDTVLQLIELEIDYIGFIFYEASPRNCSEVLLTELKKVNFKNSRPVCVFVDSDAHSITKVIECFENPIIQFHGNESNNFCLSFGIPFWKVFGIKDKINLNDMKSYDADAILLDTHHSQLKGGTGNQFNWDLLLEIKKINKKIILAGGINQENIDNAINQDVFCLDINSGVESAPGNKEISLIKEIIYKVRA